MRTAGEKVAKIHNLLRNFIKPGISTQDIDDFCRIKMEEMKCISGAKGYEGFPKNICTSINNVICHGIPNEKDILKLGDIISVDIAMSFNGYFGDSCFTYPVGEIQQSRKNLIMVGYQSMWETIGKIRNGVSIFDLGKSMREVAMRYGYSTTEEFCGHGIGTKMHESPLIPFFGEKSHKKILKTGEIITIEPMVTKRPEAIICQKDGWTATTVDGSDAVQFEHTVLVLENGYEVLTFNDFDKEMNQLKTNVV